MKKFIICWVPLAWKSTLSNHLNSTYGINHIPTDWFVSAFEETFPGIWIQHWFWLTIKGYEKVCKKITPFITSFINEIQNQNIYWDYVIEWCHWDLSALEKLQETHKIIVLWYPTVTTKEKLALVRKVDKGNWTNKLLDEELSEIIKFWIEISNTLQSQSKQYGFQFIDTHAEYESIFLI